jgi:hypothetical protein
MQICEWVELINLLHVEAFLPMVAQMRERCQENERNSSPVLIIYNTLQVHPNPTPACSNMRQSHAHWHY